MLANNVKSSLKIESEQLIHLSPHHTPTIACTLNACEVFKPQSIAFLISYLSVHETVEQRHHEALQETRGIQQ